MINLYILLVTVIKIRDQISDAAEIRKRVLQPLRL